MIDVLISEAFNAEASFHKIYRALVRQEDQLFYAFDYFDPDTVYTLDNYLEDIKSGQVKLKPYKEEAALVAG